MGDCAGGRSRFQVTHEAVHQVGCIHIAGACRRLSLLLLLLLLLGF
jgi:hypothetical protein